MKFSRQPDGTVVQHDGAWTLIDPRTTFGAYREFDGWWREPTPDEVPPTAIQVLDFASACGLQVTPWQQDLIERMFG